MVNRKKRLARGINSLEKQIEIHREKKKFAEEEGNEELVDYYNKEIEAKKKTKEEKERLLKNRGS